MDINKCMSCMQDISQMPCPHCGFDLRSYQDPMYALPLGRILDGRYLLGVVFAQERTGFHYTALDLSLEKVVGIFELFPADMVSRNDSGQVEAKEGEGNRDAFAGLQRQFEASVRNAFRLSAVAACVHVQDLFASNGTLYCVMERVFGETLEERINRTGPMAWEQLAPLLTQAIYAASGFHMAGLIHGNLDPEHLLITGDEVRLLPNLLSLCDTQTGGSWCPLTDETPYAPPEFLGPGADVGAWSDIYALAATACFAATGQAPAGARERAEGSGALFAGSGAGKLPGGVSTALGRAMELDPKRRYSSMAEFRTGINGDENGKKKGGQTKRSPKQKQERKQKKTPKASGGKKRNSYWILAIVVLIAAAIIVGWILYQDNLYRQAEQSFQAGDYAGAMALFEDLGNHRDAPERADEAAEHFHYENGVKAQEEESYADAIEEFLLAPNISESSQRLGECYMHLGDENLEEESFLSARDAYASAALYMAEDADVFYKYADGLLDLQNEDYASAVEKLRENTGITNDTASPSQAYHAYVESLIQEKDYDTARTVSEEYVAFCRNHGVDENDAAQMNTGVGLSQAEELYCGGYLSDAKAIFELAPEGAVYNGIDRDARLEKLEKNARLLQMEGEWKAVSGKSRLTQNSWVYWYDIGESNDLKFSIRFTLNEDDTITATGRCDWLSCASLVYVQEKSFEYTSAVQTYSISMDGIEGIRNRVSVTLNGETLQVGFMAEDGTSVQYKYERV